MFISPKVAISEGWITGINDEALQVQPNAIDFTLDNLFAINHMNLFVISEDKADKQMRGGYPIEVANTDKAGKEFWTLSPNETYDGLSNIRVNLPEGVACQLIVRSTFNRNGIFLTSGLYDSGYEGNIGFALHNRSGMASVQKGVRVGQIIFVRSDSEGMYAGGWNHAEGTHWSEGENAAPDGVAH